MITTYESNYYKSQATKLPSLQTDVLFKIMKSVILYTEC